MTEMQGAMGEAQLAGYGDVVDTRTRHAEHLRAGLADVATIDLPSASAGRHHVWHQFTIRVHGVERAVVAERLHRCGIGTSVHYPRLLSELEHVAGRASNADPLDDARRCAATVLSLPVHQHLTASELDRIVDGVRGAVGGAS